MEQLTDSTISDTEAEDQVGRQETVEYYVDELPRRVVECLYDSIPQLFQYATRGGPCLSQEDVLHLFGGRIIFRRTRRRMNMIRRAVLTGRMDLAPADLRTWKEWARPEMDPPFQEYRSWWRSHMDSPALFWYEEPGMGEEITRYPAVISTEEYFQESGNENWPDASDAEEDMEDSNWFQFMGGMDEDQFYD